MRLVLYHLKAWGQSLDACMKSENVNKFGLLNSLLHIINSHEEDSVKVIISKYLLENFEVIHEINIYEAAETCDVSRATIRRFYQDIGFTNFKSLKEDKVDYDFYLDSPKDNYDSYLSTQVIKMVEACNEMFRLKKESIVYELERAKEIVFLVSDVYTSRCLEFQKEMILLGKMVRIVSYNFEYNLMLNQLESDALVIVISISGGFLKEISDYLSTIKSRKLIISSLDEKLIDMDYNLLVQLGKYNEVIGKSVYHTFAIEYFLELLLNEYKYIISN